MAVVRTIIAALGIFFFLAAAWQPALADTPIDTIVVVVQDQTGAPLPFADVASGLQSLVTHISADAQGRVSWSFSGGTSPYTLDRICATYPPGVSPAHTTCSGPITVSPGETRTVTLVVDTSGSGGTAPSPAPALAPGRGWIFGVVTLVGAKTPVPDAVVAIDNTPLRTQTAADGSYQFPALSATDGANGGPTYTARVIPPTGYTVVGAASQQVTVQVDHGVEANFTLQPSPCRFVLGFQALHNAIPAVVGNCVDEEQHNPSNGDAVQHTTNGLLVWRKADNVTAFTNGYHTWVNGPDGVQERLNTLRFPWEANPDHLPVVP